MVGQHVSHAFARTFAPQCDHDALARPLQVLNVAHDSFEYVAVTLGALGRKVVSFFGPGIDCGSLCFRYGKWRQPRQSRGIEPSAPFGGREIETVGRQRSVRRTKSTLRRRLRTRVMIVFDLFQPFTLDVIDLGFANDGGPRNVVENGLHAIVQQGQPMLHADMSPAFTDRVIEQVIGRRRTEGRNIAEPKALDRLSRELKLSYRNKVQSAQMIRGALSFRIETPDRFERIPKKIQAHRLRHSGCIKIYDAAAHRIVAGFTNSRRSRESIVFEPYRDLVHIDHVAGSRG